MDNTKFVWENVPGHDLLLPPGEILPGDQIRLLRLVAKLNDTMPGDDSMLTMININGEILADLLDLVRNRLAVDTAAFDQFTRGFDKLEQTLELVFGYTALLGKSVSSGN